MFKNRRKKHVFFSKNYWNVMPVLVVIELEQGNVKPQTTAITLNA